MAFNQNQIVLDAMTQEDFIFSMLASGEAKDFFNGALVSLDTAAAGTVKLVEDGEKIYGRIFQVEDRTQDGLVTVSVETRFRKRVPYSGDAPTIGSSVVGGTTAGTAKVGVADNVVLDVDTVGSYAIVEQ